MPHFGQIEVHAQGGSDVMEGIKESDDRKVWSWSGVTGNEGEEEKEQKRTVIPSAAQWQK